MDEIISKINGNKGNDFNFSKDLDKLLEYYKCLILKYILIVEKGAFIMCKNNGLLPNLKTINSLYIIDDLLNGIYEYNFSNEIKDKSKEIFIDIKKFNKDNKQIVLQKSHILIDAYYSYLNRDKLDIENLENYLNFIVDNINEYIESYKKEILDLINKKDFNEPIKFILSL